MYSMTLKIVLKSLETKGRKLLNKRKRMIIMPLVLGGLLFGNIAYGMSTHAAIMIDTNSYSVSSDAVGVTKQAKYWVYNTPSSSRTLTMNAYACWIGWPYSREHSIDIVPTSVYEYREFQDRDSAFYIELVGYRRCHGSGNVTVQ